MFSKAVFKIFYQIPIEYITQTRRARKKCIIFLGLHILDNQFILTCAEMYDKIVMLTFIFYTWFSADDFDMRHQQPLDSGDFPTGE